MSIVGIEALDFGVEDLEVGKRFVTDFGLSQVSDTAFETLNGARLNLAPIDDPAGPGAGKTAPEPARPSAGFSSSSCTG